MLDRVVEAYGFTMKMQLADHLKIAASSLSARYKRDTFPADIVIQCVFETGANLEWLTTGQGKKFAGDELDIVKMVRQKLIEGQLFDSGHIMFDKAIFLPGTPLPVAPVCILDHTTQYIIERSFAEVYDGEWLVEIEGKTGIRTLTRVPVKRVRISGTGTAFDCNLDDITVIGRVVLTCK